MPNDDRPSQPNNFYRRLKRAKDAFLTGTSGAASDVRRLDPKTGKVIQVITARRARAGRDNDEVILPAFILRTCAE